ncbi:MAG: zf-HC2 domain-containing protein [Promicromonosporaceae bacterium]|nr:zf-HC2 domain-containing protein [Promicromonosporaceae bacterium]
MSAASGSIALGSRPVDKAIARMQAILPTLAPGMVGSSDPAVVDEALNALTHDERQLLWLKHVEAAEDGVIARRLSLSPTAVQRHLRRAERAMSLSFANLHAARAALAEQACTETRDLLGDYARHRVPAARRRSLESHLFSCEGCMRAFIDVRHSTWSLRDAAPLLLVGTFGLGAAGQAASVSVAATATVASAYGGLSGTLRALRGRTLDALSGLGPTAVATTVSALALAVAISTVTLVGADDSPPSGPPSYAAPYDASPAGEGAGLWIEEGGHAAALPEAPEIAVPDPAGEDANPLEAEDVPRTLRRPLTALAATDPAAAGPSGPTTSLVPPPSTTPPPDSPPFGPPSDTSPPDVPPPPLCPGHPSCPSEPPVDGGGDQGDPGDGGEPGDGSGPGTGEPGDGEPGDGGPGNGGPGDGGPGDGGPGNGEPGDGEPGDGGPGNGPILGAAEVCGLPVSDSDELVTEREVQFPGTSGNVFTPLVLSVPGQFGDQLLRIDQVRISQFQVGHCHFPHGSNLCKEAAGGRWNLGQETAVLRNATSSSRRFTATFTEPIPANAPIMCMTVG